MTRRLETERVEIMVGWLPRGVIPSCQYTVDTETREACDRETRYVFKLAGRPAKGAACEEHAQVVRHWPDLEWMKSV